MKTRLMSLLMALALLLIPAASAEFMPDHPLLADVQAGPCKSLTGQVQVVVLIVSTPGSPWTQEEVTSIRQQVQSASRMLRSEAAVYGASLSISYRFHQVSASSGPDMHNSEEWLDGVLRKVDGISGRINASAWADTPLLVYVSEAGRAFAHCQSNDSYAEYAVLYRGDGSGVIRHEMLHLFGAQDYYVEETIAAAAGRLFPTSIMLHSDYSGTVDPLTAYVIGWTTGPGVTGLQLLEETSSVTTQGFIESQVADQVTGLGVTSDASSAYNGMLEDGVPHGWGQITWKNGDSYLGFWTQGERNGRGLYIWEDGTVFAGDFAHGKRTGWGATAWPTGGSYTGGYQEGQRHGHGVYTWANGDVYTGEFVLGERTGQGTLVKADGTVYTGGFVGGEFEGQGTIIFSDGSCYTGGFKAGRLHGTGTYHWASGSSFTGEFANGKRHGHGVYRSENGGLLEGEWVNDQYTK